MVIDGEDVKREVVYVVQQSFVIDKEFSKQTKVLTVKLRMKPIYLVNRDADRAFDVEVGNHLFGAVDYTSWWSSRRGRYTQRMSIPFGVFLL